MTATLQTNPLREGLVSRATPRPCSIVIFGATGDLTHRKLVPALYNLAADGDLPAGLNVVGFARRETVRQRFGDGGTPEQRGPPSLCGIGDVPH
jgi:glucose-6-phosphate 1-dehydrogenase